jgi:HSP20 family protein
MILQRYDPIQDIVRPEQVFDRLWRGYGTRGYGYRGVASQGDGDWAIALDVVGSEDSVAVHASLPGVKPEDISVTIEDDVLTVSGSTATEDEGGDDTYLVRERRSGSFRRSLRLPDTVDADKAESTYEDGVLTVTLPKSEAKKPKQLTVQVKGAKALKS